MLPSFTLYSACTIIESERNISNPFRFIEHHSNQCNLSRPETGIPQLEKGKDRMEIQFVLTENRSG